MKTSVPCHNNNDPIKPTPQKLKKMCVLGKIPRRNDLEEPEEEKKKATKERKYFQVIFRGSRKSL